jgi:outer membrane lipase/esterase
VAAQIDAHLATSNFSGTDLVTVLAGSNDILEQYALYDGTNEAALIAAVEAAGIAIAQQVNRIAVAGGKVLVSTVPDLGLTPFAIAENTANPGRAELLSRLCAAFNVRIRANIINDGHMIGLLLTDELTQLAVKAPSAFSLANVTTAVCDPAKAASVELCTSQTLVTDATSGTYLWADSKLFSTGGHRLLGNSAVSRASGNPF